MWRNERTMYKLIHYLQNNAALNYLACIAYIQQNPGALKFEKELNGYCFSEIQAIYATAHSINDSQSTPSKKLIESSQKTSFSQCFVKKPVIIISEIFHSNLGSMNYERIIGDLSKNSNLSIQCAPNQEQLSKFDNMEVVVGGEEQNHQTTKKNALFLLLCNDRIEIYHQDFLEYNPFWRKFIELRDDQFNKIIIVFRYSNTPGKTPNQFLSCPVISFCYHPDYGLSKAKDKIRDDHNLLSFKELSRLVSLN
jgi:hypothetical protein